MTIRESTLIFLAAALLAGNVLAFGTEPPVKGVGAEHQRITRTAIDDLEPATLDQLAGRDNDPGAVGAFERIAVGARGHCDDGDHMAGSYPRSAADAEVALTACRALVVAELEGAVTLAKELVSPTAESVALGCNFLRGAGSAKCEILKHLGRAFHTAQDFYAHTNWTDAADSAMPPGLGNKGRAPWLDPRTQTAFPQGLISGCHAGGQLLHSCEYGSWVPVLGVDRLTRSALGKDLGPIGQGVGGTGFTPRGAVNNNFKNAVAAAVDDTRDKWAYFKERVRAVYGADGEMILCALSRDTFDAAACAKVAASAQVCAGRRAAGADASFAPGDGDRTEAEPVALRLQRFCQLEEAELTRDAVLSGGVSADGRAIAKARAIEVLATWNACPVEARSYLDRAGPTHKEALRTRQPGEKTSSRRQLLSAAYGDCILAARLRELGK
ncbi:MAG: hypothetical protein HOP13_19180 [Alphaproteobacteria bacterium]|nr:hypothetical protein [Alphaproteobacteria bacterium]